MRVAAILFLLAGVILIAFGRHLVRRAPRAVRMSGTDGLVRSSLHGRVGGWTLTILGFLSVLIGVTLW